MKKMTFPRILIVLVVGVAAVFVGRKIYFKPNFINGEVATNFSGTLPSGEQMELKDLKGNYVLLDFWGSWCGPCRVESPDLVRLYDQFHDKQFKNASNFEIVSVGLETRKERWLKAIADDNLHWKYHISELGNFDAEIAKLYGVRQIPSKFLINPDGVIVGVNQSVKEIETWLNKQL